MVYLCYRHSSRRPSTLRLAACLVARHLTSRNPFGPRQQPCPGQDPVWQDLLVGLEPPRTDQSAPAGSATLRLRTDDSASAQRRRRRPCHGMTPTRPSGGVFGFLSNILVRSSLGPYLGRPAAPRRYGPGRGLLDRAADIIARPGCASESPFLTRSSM